MYILDDWKTLGLLLHNSLSGVVGKSQWLDIKF